MSSDDGCWAADQGSSSAHQSVRKISTQAAKLSEDGVSSQPELEESSQSKTTERRTLVSWDDVVPRLVPRGLLMVMVLVLSIFGFWLQEKVMQQPRPLRLLALVQMLALLLTLAWNEHLLRNYMHMHNRVSPEVVQLVKLLLVVTMAGMAGRMLSLWWQEVLLAEMVVLLLIINLDRVVNFWRVKNTLWRDHKKKNFWHVGTHGHSISPVKCGPHEWVLDCGAEVHQTSNLELLLEVEQFQEMDNKGSPPSSGDEAAASHVQMRGSVRTDRFDFPGVHYVTEGVAVAMNLNIVSVSQLAHDHGLATEFGPRSCCIKEKKTGKIVGKGRRLRNGVYILDYLRIVDQYVAGDRGACSGGEQGSSKLSIEEIFSLFFDNHHEIQETALRMGEVPVSKKKIQEMDNENVDKDDNGRTQQEINGNMEDGDKKRGHRGGGSTFEESSNKASMGLLGLSRFVLVLCLCIAACMSLLQCSWGTGVICKLAAFNNLDFRSLLGVSLLFISSLDMLQSTSRKLVRQIGFLFQESPHEHSRRLFGLSRFDDVTTGHGRYQLPIGAFPASSTNAARHRREEFILDSGASFHTTWNEQIIASYPKDLKDHTEPPTRSLKGVIGSIGIESSGYLSFFGKIKLDGVLLAPESRLNLISIGQLTAQYQVIVVMDNKGFIIKREQDGVTIGGGKMIDNHLYQLEYFEPPGGLFALSRTPDFKIFGNSDPGRPQVNTDPCPAHSTTTEETVSPSANQQKATESSSLGEHRSRKRNRNYFGPLWFNG